MYAYIGAVLGAQVRMLRHFYARRLGGAALAAGMALLWYGVWAWLAAVVFFWAAHPHDPASMARLFAGGLFLVFLYWQGAPLAMAATGAGLDWKRLLVYPVPRRQWFALEVALRLSVSVEMLLLLGGAALGLLRNPAAPLWAPLAFIPFAVINLFLSAGFKELFARLLARRWVREVAVFCLVMLAALPQYLTSVGDPGRNVRRILSFPQSVWLPWSAAGRWAAGQSAWPETAVLAAWVVAACWFGRRQFEKSLRFDVEAAGAAERAGHEAAPLLERLFRLPSRLLPDPLGAMVEKEMRFLSRAPRFRLLFLMGFTFGVAIWLPLRIGRERGPEFLTANLLVLVSMYALLLLGEAVIWNVFGYDRSAAQFYFLAPVPFRQVMAAKNIAAAVLVLLELGLILLVCMIVRIPVTGAKVVEAFAVTTVLLSYLMSFGNLTSVYYPKGIDPGQSWKSSARSFQIMLVLIYPIAAFPLALPYLARYAFSSEAAFYAVLPLNLALGAWLYRLGMESAVSAVGARKERILAALRESGGPISMNV